MQSKKIYDVRFLFKVHIGTPLPRCASTPARHSGQCEEGGGSGDQDWQPMDPDQTQGVEDWRKRLGQDGKSWNAHSISHEWTSYSGTRDSKYTYCLIRFKYIQYI